MSSPSSNDPRHEASAQSDESLVSRHAPADAKNGSTISLGTSLTILFAFLLCSAGVYFDRNSGDLSVSSFNEDAHGGAVVSTKPKAVDMVAFGKKQYLAACVTCHQATGAGVPGTYPPLAGSEWVNGSEERLVRIVLHGLTGPVTVAGVQYPGTVQMPSFGQVPNSGYNWRDDQIAAVLTYVRQEWGNKGAAITTAKVNEIRSKVTRDKPWTAAELGEVQ